ncbi:MAG: hypothetical protein WBI96_03245 [Candidatus Hydrothermia bacterium]
MKKLLYIIPVALLVILSSCGEEVGNITPANLEVVAYSDGTQVKLTWEAPVDEVDGYILEFVNASGTLMLTDTLAPTIYSYTHDPEGYVGTYKLYGYLGDSLSSPATVSTVPQTFATLNLIIHELDQAGNSGLALGDAGDWEPTSYGCSASGAPENVDFYFTDASQGSTGMFQYIASADRLPTTWEESTVGNNTSGWKVNFIERKSPQDGEIEDITAKYGIAVPNGVYCFKVVRSGVYYFGVLELGSVSKTQTTIKNLKIQNIPGLRIIGR